MARPLRGSEQFRHDLRPVAELRKRAAEMLRRARRTRRPVILTQDGAPAGVLLDAASYSELRETALLQVVQALGRRSEQSRPGTARRRPRLR